jgi:hypothetical protein
MQKKYELYKQIIEKVDQSKLKEKVIIKKEVWVEVLIKEESIEFSS